MYFCYDMSRAGKRLKVGGFLVGVVNEQQGQRSRSLPTGSTLQRWLKLLVKQRLCLCRLQTELPASVLGVRGAFEGLSGNSCPSVGKES